jgi:hypothetical protein
VSYEHINYVRDHSKTRGAARLLLLTIATRTDPNGEAFPSYKCLEADTGMGQRSIRRLLETLPPSELEIIPGGSIKGGKRTATTYRIIVPESVNNAADRAPDAHGPGATDRAPDAHGPGMTVRLVSPDRAPGAHLTVIEQKEKERAQARDGAGQAGSHPDFFVVTESESQTPHSSAPTPIQSNGASDATLDRHSRARVVTRSRKPRVKSIRLPCELPDQDECVEFALSRNISEIDAKEQLEEWQLSGGYDGVGNPILNWKQKLVAFRNSGNLPSDKRAKRNGSSNHRHTPKQKGFCDI